MIDKIKEDIGILAENILNGEYCEKCKTPCDSNTKCYKQQTEIYNTLEELHQKVA